MKQGQITINRTFDAMMDAGVDPTDTRRLADQVDAVCAYIDSRPDIYGGPVDRRGYGRQDSDVWDVMRSIWLVQEVLAGEGLAEGSVAERRMIKAMEANEFGVGLRKKGERG